MAPEDTIAANDIETWNLFMIALDGYKIIQKVQQERHIAFYEAISEDGGSEPNTTYLIAHQILENPTEEELDRIEAEFKLILTVRSENLVQVFDYKKVRTANRFDLFFVCEYHKAKNLKDFPLLIRTDLNCFLEFAIGLTEAANLLHQQGLLLKEVNPSTLLVRNGAGKMMVNTQ